MLYFSLLFCDFNVFSSFENSFRFVIFHGCLLCVLQKSVYFVSWQEAMFDVDFVKPPRVCYVCPLNLDYEEIIRFWNREGH